MALVLALNAAVFDVSAAETVPVVDVSQFESLTEDKVDPNGVWEYIYENADYDSSDPDSVPYARRLVIYKDVILTGENEHICFEPRDAANITIKNLSIAAGQGDVACTCGDNDVFCDGDWSNVWTGSFTIEGNNKIVNDYYLFYCTLPVNVYGSGVLDVVIGNSEGDSSSLILDGPAINIDGDLWTRALTVKSGALNVDGELRAEETADTIDCPVPLSISGGKVTAKSLDARIYDLSGNNDDKISIELSGGELKVEEGILAQRAIDDASSTRYEGAIVKVSGGKLTAGVLSCGRYIQTGGIALLNGWDDEANDDKYPGMVITASLEMSGGCLKSKGFNPPAADVAMGAPEVISVYFPAGTASSDDVLKVTAPAKLVSGKYVAFEVDEDVYARVISGDLHICVEYNIAVKAENGTVEVPTTAYVGETVEVKTTANEGYELKSITVNGEKLDGTTFTMPAKDVEIIAAFEKIPENNPATGDMEITFTLAAAMVAVAAAFVSIKKMRSM